MDEELCELHYEDDKTLLEKNKKRTVKTHAQVQALEGFYDEHKYPTESMKIQFAESIGLTEKQVSGWFCHRRLKDKRLMNGENHAVIRQDRLSGVIQDRGSGHRQDSCGSTKSGHDKNLDTREIDSERVNLQEYSPAELTYDASSGSSSSLHNMPISNNHSGYNFHMPSSRYVAPKVAMDVKGVKTRPGPSGYLKVKGNIENAAVTAVKRQLGKLYRVDGPPLGIEFDPLPPGAFESSMQEPVDETYYSEEAVLPASHDISTIHQHPKFGKGCEYNSSMGPRNPNIDRTFINMTQGPDIPNSYIHQKLRKNTSFSVSSHCHLRPYGVKKRGERENRYHKHNSVSIKISRRENEYFSSSMKHYEYNNSLDKMQPTKDDRAYAERRMGPKRMRRIFSAAIYEEMVTDG